MVEKLFYFLVVSILFLAISCASNSREGLKTKKNILQVNVNLLQPDYKKKHRSLLYLTLGKLAMFKKSMCNTKVVQAYPIS